MDLQGVGAIAAAAVAAVSIPISPLVGRWQMRGAVKTAEATYKAAVDAVRNQANLAHQQWRRGVQRDAYAAFLLAAHRVESMVGRIAVDRRRTLDFPEDLKAEANAALGDLQKTHSIALIEASETVQDNVHDLYDAAFDFGTRAIDVNSQQRAINYLFSKAEEESPSVDARGNAETPGPWTRVARAYMAIAGCVVSGMDVTAPDRRDITAEFYNAYKNLPAEEAPRHVGEILRDSAENMHTQTREVSVREYHEARRKFVLAVKEDLERPIHS
ncbi:hypothetical protein [Streptomyces asiaticus]